MIPHAPLQRLLLFTAPFTGQPLVGRSCGLISAKKKLLRIFLRLARGMSYMSAAAELPVGGGKGLIKGDPHL